MKTHGSARHFTGKEHNAMRMIPRIDNTTPTSKEKNMNKKCVAITAGLTSCRNGACDTITGEWDMSMTLYKGVRPALMGDKAYVTRTVEVCTSHRASFHKMGALRVNMPVLNTTIKPKEAEVQTSVFEIPVSDVRTSVFHFPCGYCKKWHQSLIDIAACGGKVRNDVIVDQQPLKNKPFPMKDKVTHEIIAWWFPTNEEAQKFNREASWGYVRPAKPGKLGFWAWKRSAEFIKQDEPSKMKSIKCGKCHNVHTGNTLADVLAQVKNCQG